MIEWMSAFSTSFTCTRSTQSGSRSIDSWFMAICAPAAEPSTSR